MENFSQAAFGFFSSGRNEAILRSSGNDPVDSDRLITVLNIRTRAEQKRHIMVAGRGSSLRALIVEPLISFKTSSSDHY